MEEIARFDGASDEARELRVKIYELSQAAPGIFEKAGLEKKRILMNLVFEKIEVRGEEFSYVFKEPFATLAKAAEETNRSKAAKLIKSPIQIFEPKKRGSKKGERGPMDAQTSTLLRLLDKFRTLNWREIEKELSLSGLLAFV